MKEDWDMTKTFSMILRGSAASVALLAFIVVPSLAQDSSDEEIVVTAQKRSEAVQKVPVAITAFSEQMVKDLNITSTDSIARFVPNLEIGLPSGKGNQPLISIRGVGLNDFNTNNSGPNGVYVDEVYVSAPSAQTFAVFDLERIEVLKGPQGTLYGRNTTGGAINYIAVKPSEELQGGLRVSAGTFDTYQVEGAIGGAIADGVRGRFAFVRNYSDGYVRNLLDGERTNGSNDWAIRALLDVDLSDSVTVQLNFHGGEVDTLPAEYRLVGTLDGPFGAVCSNEQIEARACVDTLGYGGAENFHAGSYNRTQHLKVKNYGGSARLDYDAGSFTLTSISAYDTNDKFHPEDSDASPFRNLEIDYGVDSDTFTQEFRAAGGGETYNWLAGLYYLHEDLNQDQSVYVLLDLDTLFGPGAGDGGAQIARSLSDQKTESYAAFGQADFTIAEGLKLTLGGRYTYEEKSFAVDGLLAIQGIGAPSGTIGELQPIWGFAREIDDGAFSGRVALDYQATDDLLLYASISTGYKSGGFNGGFLSSDPGDAEAQVEPIKPETVIAYEAGIKSDWLDKKLRINGAVFYYDYSDLQVFNLIPAVEGGSGFPVQVLANAKSAEITGAELEVVARPTDDLTLSANFGFLDTSLGSFVTDAGEDFTGNRLALSPKFSFTGIGTYEIPFEDGSTVKLQGVASYRSKQFFDIRNDPLLVQDGFWLLDARISYTSADGRWEVAAYGKNLTDENYLNFAVNLTSVFGLIEQNVGAPATGGIEVSYRY